MSAADNSFHLNATHMTPAVFHEVVLSSDYDLLFTCQSLTQCGNGNRTLCILHKAIVMLLTSCFRFLGKLLFEERRILRLN